MHRSFREWDPRDHVIPAWRARQPCWVSPPEASSARREATEVLRTRSNASRGPTASSMPSGCCAVVGGKFPESTLRSSAPMRYQARGPSLQYATLAGFTRMSKSECTCSHRTRGDEGITVGRLQFGAHVVDPTRDPRSSRDHRRRRPGDFRRGRVECTGLPRDGVVPPCTCAHATLSNRQRLVTADHPAGAERQRHSSWRRAARRETRTAARFDRSLDAGVSRPPAGPAPASRRAA